MSFDTVALRARGPLIRVRSKSYSSLTRVMLEFVPVQPGNSRIRELWHRMLNHPLQSPTVPPCCSYFPVFSSPTATLEVVGNTGNPSSEKAGVSGSTPNPGTTFQVMRAGLHVFAQTQSVVHSRANPCGYGASAASNLRKNGAEPVEPAQSISSGLTSAYIIGSNSLFPFHLLGPDFHALKPGFHHLRTPRAMVSILPAPPFSPPHPCRHKPKASSDRA